MLTPTEWAMGLQMAAARIRSAELTLEVEHALGHVAKDAQAMIGTEMPEWPALAESTVEEKQRLGFTGQRSPTDPLLRTGVLESSISAQAERRGMVVRGVIGSDDEIAIYQELGTSRIPPRPFLSSALLQGTEVIGEHLGQFLVRVITNHE